MQTGSKKLFSKKHLNNLKALSTLRSKPHIAEIRWEDLLYLQQAIWIPSGVETTKSSNHNVVCYHPNCMVWVENTVFICSRLTWPKTRSFTKQAVIIYRKNENASICFILWIWRNRTWDVQLAQCLLTKLNL